MITTALLLLTLNQIPRAYESVGANRILVADLDLDGNPDVITDGGPTGWILYGRADGGFEPAVPIGDPVTSYSSSMNMVIADFDRDQLPDLVLTPFSGTPRAVLLHNRGQRRFEERLLLNNYARAFAAADFTGDGAPDLLFDAMPDTLLLINDGHGAFPISRVILGMETEWPDPAIGDVDGDGDLDLSAMRAGVTSLYINDGTAKFEKRPVLENIAFPFFADLERDGRSDLVALRYTANEVAVHLSSRPLAPPAVVAAGLNPRTAAAGDFNNDGALDVAVLNDGASGGGATANTSSVILYLGDGHGGLTRASEVLIPRQGRYGIAVADTNHDGALDLLVPSISGVSVVLGNGDGTLRVPSTVPGVAFTRVFAAVDFDGDGGDEVLVASWDSRMHAGWLQSDGRYRFDPVPVSVGYSSPFAVGGGKLVIAKTRNIHVLSASAPGQWTDNRIDAGETVLALQGWNDRIAAISQTGERATLKVFLRDGSLLDSYSLWPSPSKEAFYRNPFRIHAADVDRDGTMDLIVTAFPSTPTWFHDRTVYKDAYIEWFRGRADGTYAPPEVLLVDRPVYAVAVADFNGDGAVDITLQGVAFSAFTLDGDGAGHFIEGTSSIGFVPELIADLNLDGVLDFKKGGTIVYGTLGKTVRYHDSTIGSVLVRRMRGGPLSLAGSVDERGDLFFVDLVSEGRRRGARH